MKYRLPKKSQWRQFLKILTKEEKISFFIFSGLFLISLIFLSINFYFKITKISPDYGGEYSEGLVGYPRFINPIYAPISDVDRDLTEIIFSGLMKYGSDGKIQPDLVKEYKILDGEKIYEFYLKDKLFWQDGQSLTADDVIFTIETIQNPDIKSPLRPNWLGVEVEKISDNAIRFKLKDESSVFLEIATVKIIPKHIWEKVSPENFALSQINLDPIGSGPYKLKNLSQDKDGKITSLDLVRNSKYYGRKPYLTKITLRFFDSEEKLVQAFASGAIKGFYLSPTENLPPNGIIHSFSLPRYFAVFFNQKNSKILTEKDIRLALNYGTNKNEILDKILLGYGKIVDSPILPDIYGLKEPEKIYQFDPALAKELLEKAGFQDTDGDGFREKIVKKELSFQFKSNLFWGSQGAEVTELQKCLARDSEIYPEREISGYFGEKTKLAVIKFQEKYSEEILKPAGLESGNGEVKDITKTKLNEVCFGKPEEELPLKISLSTVEQPLLVQTAEILKNQWNQLGIEVEIKNLDITTLTRDILRKRDFEALLFGEVLGLIPDPYPFWDSSQKGELGLNLANWENKKADKLLEENRKSLDSAKLEEFQNLLIEDAPTVFLYNPDYLCFISKEIKGVNERVIADPSKRFSNISDWHINTKRVLK